MIKTLICALVVFSTASLSRAAISFDTQNTAALRDELAAPGLSAALPMPDRPRGGEALVPAKSIQLRVENNSVNLAGYTAVMSVHCSHKSGLVWPQAQSCGSRELPVEITAGGRLLVPAIEAFDNSNGRDIDNFDMTLALYEKGATKTRLFALSVRGKGAFSAYQREEAVYSVLKMNEGRIEVLVDGKPLAGSDLAKDQKASMTCSVSQGFKPGDLEIISLLSPLAEIQSFDNKGYGGESLAGFKELVLKSAVLIEKVGDERPLVLKASLRYDGIQGVSTMTYQVRVEISKTANGLAGIGRINLVRVQ